MHSAESMADNVRQRRRFEFTVNQIYNHLYGRASVHLAKAGKLGRDFAERQTSNQPENLGKFFSSVHTHSFL